MTNKTLIAGAIGLALALGCEDEPDAEDRTYVQQEEIAPAPSTEQSELGDKPEPSQELGEPTALNEEPGVPLEPQVGAEPATGMELTQGQPMSRRSGSEFDRTVRMLRTELENADYVIAGVVPLEQPAQPEEQPPAQGTETPGAAKPEGEQGRAELILFASQNALGDVQGDPLTVLGSPTAILVYEDALTGDVMVGFDDPELAHVVDATTAAEDQPIHGMEGTQGTRGTRGTQGMQQQESGPMQQDMQGTTQPGTTQPGTQPGTTQPGTTQPGTTQPGGVPQPEGMEEEESELRY